MCAMPLLDQTYYQPFDWPVFFSFFQAIVQYMAFQVISFVNPRLQAAKERLPINLKVSKIMAGRIHT